MPAHVHSPVAHQIGVSTGQTHLTMRMMYARLLLLYITCPLNTHFQDVSAPPTKTSKKADASKANATKAKGTTK
jgi:hypothetical protein